MTGFHPLVSRWFLESIGEPTAAQRRGWEAIRSGQHTSIAAPTGSGKTLAAFLTTIDDLVREGAESPLPDAVRVVYVSPLKALSADIHKNLAEPRRALRHLAEASGLRDSTHHGCGADRRHHLVRACRDAAYAAAHPGHDTGIALSAPHGRAQPSDASDDENGDRR